MMGEINFDKRCSIESEMSEASTLISTSSENFAEEEGRRRKRINHHSIRSTLSDSEMEMSGVGSALSDSEIEMAGVGGVLSVR